MEGIEVDFRTAVATVKAVYKECWDEFYAWYCTGLVNTLDLGACSLTDLQGEAELEDRVPPGNNTLALSSDTSNRLTYVDGDALDLEDELVEPELQQVKSMNITLEVKTVPPYSSYQSIRHSVYLRGDLWKDNATGSELRLAPKVDDNQNTVLNADELERDSRRIEKRELVNIEVEDNMARNQESMPFIPLDIPVGVREEHAQAFHDIEEWQDSGVHWDNNEDMIEGETIRRLIFTHQMSKDTIDRTQVLPRSVEKLCYTLKNRTCPDLNVIYPTSSNLPPLPIEELLQTKIDRSLAAQVNETAMLNCYHIDCQAVMCHTHYPARRRAEKKGPGERGRGPQFPRRPEHKLTSRQLFTMGKYEKQEICGDQCFLSLEASSVQDNSSDIVVNSDEVELDERIVSDMRDIWGMMPDALPCYVAIMSLGSFSCRQAYMTRCQMFPDPAESESGSGTDTGSEGRPRKGRAKAVERKNLPGFEECDHPGPCENNSKCPCFANERHCLRDCACDFTCKQRQTGCTCTKTSKTNICRTSRCKCYLNRRECDPELCRGCSARAGHPCTNVQLLLGMWKPTKVKPSEYGNGLFLGAEQAMKGDLIVEYTGDIIHPRSASRRTMVSFHTKRNYIFDVDQDGLTYSIDAGMAGNESRFINHPVNGNPNCEARFVYVCGQLRLGIYALQAIYPGQELFIHYGEGFFAKDNPEGGTSAGSESGASAVEEGYASGEDDEDEYGEDDSGSSISL